MRDYGPFFLGSLLATPLELWMTNGDWLLIGIAKIITMTLMCGSYWGMVVRRREGT